MLHLERDGQALLLPADASAQVEHKNPLLSELLEDSYSTEVDLPVEGNERVLGHVHELNNEEHGTTLDDVRMGHAGLPLFPGALHVLNSTPRHVRASFVLEGFVDRIKGLTLKQALAGERIDLAAEGLDYHELPKYAQGGRMRFPMFFNKDLYGGENPDWWPTASAWDPARTYAVNDLVEYEEIAGGLLRTGWWQCLATSTNDRPETSPAKWRRVAYGLVNAWDADNNRHYQNSTASYYAMVPWFYLKWVLKRALASIGWTPVGAFMDDASKDELAVPNVTTIDRALLEDETSYFQAGKDSPTYYDIAATPGEVVVKADTESPSPLQDPDGLWDSGTHEFIPDEAGTWVLRFQATLLGNPPQSTAEAVGAPGVTIQRVLRIYVYRNGATWWPAGFGYNPISLGAPIASTSNPYGAVRDVSAALSFGAADVGQRFQFRARIALVVNGQQAGTIWPWTDSVHGLSDVRVTGYRQNDAPGAAMADKVILPHRHVPDVDLGGYLQAVADAYNLELDPDEATRQLRMNYKEDVLVRPERHTTECSERMLADPEVDHQRAVPGARLHWPNSADPDPEAAGAESCFTDADLPPAHTTGQVCVAKATRKLYRSVFHQGYFAWKHVGHHVPDVVVGANDDRTRTITPALQPVPMREVFLRAEGLGSKQYLVPELNATGTSAWFHTKGDEQSTWICEMAEARSSDGAVTGVPCARTWGWGWDSLDKSATTLLWDDGYFPGLWQAHWKRWLAMLTTALPVTADLLVDPAFVKGGAWRRLLNMHSQRYLVETLPVEYGLADRLRCEGAYLLRLTPAPRHLRADPCAFAAPWPGEITRVDFAATAQDREDLEAAPIAVGATYLIIEHDTGTPGSDIWERHTGEVATYVGGGEGEEDSNWTFAAIAEGVLVALAAGAPYWIIVKEVGGTLYSDNGGTGLFACVYNNNVLPVADDELVLLSTDTTNGTASNRAGYADRCRRCYVEWSEDNDTWHQLSGPHTETEALDGIPTTGSPEEASYWRFRWERGQTIQAWSQS